VHGSEKACGGLLGGNQGGGGSPKETRVPGVGGANLGVGRPVWGGTGGPGVFDRKLGHEERGGDIGGGYVAHTGNVHQACDYRGRFFKGAFWAVPGNRPFSGGVWAQKRGARKTEVQLGPPGWSRDHVSDRWWENKAGSGGRPNRSRNLGDQGDIDIGDGARGKRAGGAGGVWVSAGLRGDRNNLFPEGGCSVGRLGQWLDGHREVGHQTKGRLGGRGGP